MSLARKTPPYRIPPTRGDLPPKWLTLAAVAAVWGCDVEEIPGKGLRNRWHAEFSDERAEILKPDPVHTGVGIGFRPAR